MKLTAAEIIIAFQSYQGEFTLGSSGRCDMCGDVGNGCGVRVTQYCVHDDEDAPAAELCGHCIKKLTEKGYAQKLNETNKLRTE